MTQQRLVRFFSKYGIYLIVLIGFALRILFATTGVGLPIARDEGAYYQRALEVAKNFLGEQEMFRPPFWPYVLALFVNLVGQGRAALGYVPALIDTASIALIYSLARAIFKRRDAGLLAAFIFATYPEFIAFARLLYSETMFIFLSALGFWTLLRAVRARSARRSLDSTLARRTIPQTPRDRGAAEIPAPFPAPKARDLTTPQSGAVRDESQRPYMPPLAAQRRWDEKTPGSGAPGRAATWAAPDVLFFVAGIVLACAGLTRDLMAYFALVLIPLWLLIIFAPRWKSSVAPSVALWLGLAIVLVPWIVRNWNIEHRLVLVATAGEYTLARYNVKAANQVRAANDDAEDDVPAKEQVRAALENLPPNERSGYALRQTLDAITSAPLEWLLAKTQALRALWGPVVLDREYFRIDDVDAQLKSNLDVLFNGYFVALVLFGTWGFFISKENDAKLLISLYLLYSLLIFILTHFQARYRPPLVEFLVPYAAFGFNRVMAALGRGVPRPLWNWKQPRVYAAALTMLLFAALMASRVL